jgi:hypothetical protein
MTEKRPFFFSERGLGEGSSSERRIDERCLYRVMEERPLSERELEGASSWEKRIDERCLYGMVEEGCVWELDGGGWLARMELKARRPRCNFEQWAAS